MLCGILMEEFGRKFEVLVLSILFYVEYCLEFCHDDRPIKGSFTCGPSSKELRSVLSSVLQVIVTQMISSSMEFGSSLPRRPGQNIRNSVVMCWRMPQGVVQELLIYVWEKSHGGWALLFGAAHLPSTAGDSIKEWLVADIKDDLGIQWTWDTVVVLNC